MFIFVWAVPQMRSFYYVMCLKDLRSSNVPDCIILSIYDSL